MGLLHPRLFDLRDVHEAVQGQETPLPTPISAISAAKVLAEGIYLLENGAFAYIYIGPEAPAHLQSELLGRHSPPIIF